METGATLATTIAGSVFFAMNPGTDDVIGTAYPRGYLDRSIFTVEHAGPALHAAILIDQERFFILKPEHRMRANLQTGFAAGALIPVQVQGGYSG